MKKIQEKRDDKFSIYFMPTLPPKPTIKDFQKYVQELEAERGFQEQSTVQKCLLLGEEVGELFKAVRKNEA